LTLDKLLSVRNSINLKSKNLFSVRSVAASYDNNIWVYDEQYFKIKKFDDQFNLLLESPDISLLAENIQFSTQNTQPSPVQLLDYDKQVFFTTKLKVFIFLILMAVTKIIYHLKTGIMLPSIIKRCMVLAMMHFSLII
jgi:hypothetical protein